MREIVVNTFVSVDGVLQAPGGPQEDPWDGFEYGGKSARYVPPSDARVVEQIRFAALPT